MKKLIAFLAVIMLIAATTSAYAEILFTDNFNTSVETSDLNYELNARQTGSLATIGYMLKSGSEGNVGLNTTLNPTKPLILIAPPTSGYSQPGIYLNRNFNDYFVVGTSINFSVKMKSDTEDGTLDQTGHLADIVIGDAGSDVNYGTGFAIEMRNTPGHYINGESGSRTWEHEKFYQWDINILTTALGKQVTVKLDGEQVYNELLNKPNWTNAYLNFIGYTYPDTVARMYAFDDVSITAVPEPGSLLALGTGLVGLAGFVIRKRK